MPGFVNYKKGCTRLAVASDQVYQLLAHGRWFSPGTPASSTTKTGHQDIADILLKVVLNTKNQNQSTSHFYIQLIFDSKHSCNAPWVFLYKMLCLVFVLFGNL
jgi:hypothetical protein